MINREVNCIGQVFKNGLLVNPCNHLAGYKLVNCGGLKLVHRLVAEKYIPNKLNKRTVNHKDGNKANNKLSNLEWATDSENNLHAYKVLGRKAPMQNKVSIQRKACKFINTITGDELYFNSLTEASIYFDTNASTIHLWISKGKNKKYDLICEC